jgi:hypothetical protein
MRTLGQPFNAVSREKIVHDIYALVDPLDGWLDNSTLVAGANPLLSVTVVDPAVISVQWLVDGSIVAGATGSTFHPVDFGVGIGIHTIVARAYDPTDWVRDDRSDLEQSITWSVRVDAALPLHNPDDPHDVDANGVIDIHDALIVIQFLRQAARGIELPNTGPPFPDSTGDNLLRIDDALEVIREIRRQRSLPAGDGESEAISTESPKSGPAGPTATEGNGLFDLLLPEGSAASRRHRRGISFSTLG